MRDGSSGEGSNFSTKQMLEFVQKIAEAAASTWGKQNSAGNLIPDHLKKRICRWKYGDYGWASPVSLLITAAWYKALNPQQDVCRIWADDGKGISIVGGFSIRNNDEKVTIPTVCRFNIWPYFCSNNSGMQGSRALEKARSHARVERNTSLEQKVKFDLSLFAEILNDINELSKDQAVAACQFFFEQGFEIKNKRDTAIKRLGDVNKNKIFKDVSGFVLKACDQLGDPQFVRCVVAAVLHLKVNYIPALKGGIVRGNDSKKTGADTQTSGPGDLWIDVNGAPCIAAEVKDKSKKFDFTILSAVRARLKNNPTIRCYLMITAAELALDEQALMDLEWNRQLDAMRMTSGCAIVALTLRDYLGIQCAILPLETELLLRISECLISTPDLKKESIEEWTKILVG